LGFFGDFLVVFLGPFVILAHLLLFLHVPICALAKMRTWHYSKIRIFVKRAGKEVNMVDPYMLFFKALSSRSRILILRLLSTRGEISVEELAELLHLASPTVSRHLQLLRLQEIVTVRRDAQSRYYSLNKERLGRRFTEFLDSLTVAPTPKGPVPVKTMEVDTARTSQ
jgi:DNA-binding transcriptional ArsR family regulator